MRVKPLLGCTRRGVLLCERACFCLLSAFYKPPLLRTLLRTSVSIETLTRRLLRTLLRSTSFEEPSKNPSKKRAVAWPPWCAPYLRTQNGTCEFDSRDSNYRLSSTMEWRESLAKSESVTWKRLRPAICDSRCKSPFNVSSSFTGGKSTRKNPPGKIHPINKKVHLNREGRSSRELFERVCVNAVSFWYFRILGGFLGLYSCWECGVVFLQTSFHMPSCRSCV